MLDSRTALYTDYRYKIKIIPLLGDDTMKSLVIFFVLFSSKYSSLYLPNNGEAGNARNGTMPAMSIILDMDRPSPLACRFVYGHTK